MYIKGKAFGVVVLMLLISPFACQAASTVDNMSTNLKSTGQELAVGAEDAAITTKIKALFTLEADIRSFDLHVTTRDKIVHLSGQVDTNLQKNRAIELAQSVKEVIEVDDSDLKVTKSENYFSDAMTTARSKIAVMRLSSDGKLSGDNELHIETTNGIVHVFGHVASKEDMDAVVKAISGLKDVKSVNTNIDVKK